MNLAHVLVMWVCGVVLYSTHDGTVETWVWPAIASGWLWVAGTWFLQPLMIEQRDS